MKCSPRRLSAFQGFAAAPLFGAIALFAALPGGAFAQGNDCAGLRAQITALDRTNARANPYAGTIRSQRAGLQRTQDYAHKIGCDRQQFIFFGSPPPPQCGQINAQIEQLRASLAQLEANARGILDTPQRRQWSQATTPIAVSRRRHRAASSAACSAAPPSRATNPILPTFPRRCAAGNGPAGAAHGRFGNALRAPLRRRLLPDHGRARARSADARGLLQGLLSECRGQRLFAGAGPGDPDGGRARRQALYEPAGCAQISEVTRRLLYLPCAWRHVGRDLGGR